MTTSSSPGLPPVGESLDTLSVGVAARVHPACRENYWPDAAQRAMDEADEWATQNEWSTT